MSIALLCPTKGRPQQFKRMMDSVAKTTSRHAVILMATNPEDWHEYKAVNGIVGYESWIMPDVMPTAYKWEILAKKAISARFNGKKISLFMLAADDMVFQTPLWDKALLDHYNALNNKIHVYALQDSRDIDGTPHIIVTREWIEAMGYFVPPIFLHWHIDSWTVEIAKANGVFTHMKDYLLMHDKPSDQGKPDATHTGIRAMGWRERDQWVADHCQYFLEYEKLRLKAALVNAKVKMTIDWKGKEIV